MKRYISIVFAFLALSAGTFAQKADIEDYNRSSLYSFSIVNMGTAYATDIFQTMIAIQHPERYNDHNLSLRVATSSGDPKAKDYRLTIDKFMTDNQIAKRLVSRWFNRDKVSGAFNMDLVRERGNYNASVEDVILANHTMRGKAMLEDAGEQLINNTFVVVNEISYIDKEAKANTVAAIFQGLAMVADATAGIAGSSGGGVASSIASLTSAGAKTAQGISDKIAGFTVCIHTYLYQLDWNDEVAGQFYSQYYYDTTCIDQSKKTAYLRDLNTFKLKYIGEYKANSSKTVIKGLTEPAQVFNKVLARAIDENIVQLQRRFPVFHVSTGVFEVTPDNQVRVHIGLKEGLTSSSKYEVLERKESENGTLSYRRVATISPEPNLIWDNRCNAVEEEADNAGLQYSTFRITSGGGVMPGMIVREIR